MGYKSDSMEDIQATAQIVQSIAEESKMHINVRDYLQCMNFHPEKEKK